MFDFDEIIDRRGTHCSKWDMMQPLYGVAPDDGLAMWVADMDFRPPRSVTAALQAEIDHGVHGYFGDDRAHKAAVVGWMRDRHGWDVDPATIATTHGLVAGFALCLQAFTEPGDGVILFTPVYHAFLRVLRANARAIVESPLVRREDGRYAMDLDALAAALTGRERMLVLCSPHNPGGRVWSRDELRALAGFCAAHDLLLVADEIHHDLVLGPDRHTPMPLAAPEIADRLVMLTAGTKTFNLAGALTGNVIIADEDLRRRFAAALAAAGSSPNRFGVLAITAAYQGGAPWVDALCRYLAGNAALFADGVAAIPGVRPMRLDATYLA
jgi:cystathionine beta-lyase